ncbi:uncharacterized protein LOC143028116 [Oratosquilla oratoria]|uniref:uncharacterized protein LOC143028116 n=1 Tax=Oratosquilla oratoria TaxID=337810 RepID=UPI003F75A4AF
MAKTCRCNGYEMAGDSNFLLDNERFIWAKRRVVRGVKKNQVLALMKEDSKIYRTASVVLSVQSGDMAWKCQSDFRCQHCGDKHNSLDCGIKIKNGQCVTPQCCNCSGKHNAGSVLCEKSSAQCNSKVQKWTTSGIIPMTPESAKVPGKLWDIVNVVRQLQQENRTLRKMVEENKRTIRLNKIETTAKHVSASIFYASTTLLATSHMERATDVMKFILVLNLAMFGGAQILGRSRNDVGWIHDGIDVLRQIFEDSLERDDEDSCSLMIVTENTLPREAIRELKLGLPHPRGEIVIELEMPLDNKTDPQVPLGIRNARKLRYISWCLAVVAVSEDPKFLEWLAEVIQKGRLLIQKIRMAVLSRMSHSEVIRLLRGPWTFSMMSTVFVNRLPSGSTMPAERRFGVYAHLPFTKQGSRVVHLASWTPDKGLYKHSDLPFFPHKFHSSGNGASLFVVPSIVIRLSGVSRCQSSFTSLKLSLGLVSSFFGATINITARPFAPYWDNVAPNGQGKRYTGMDFLLMDTIASSLKFFYVNLPTANWNDVSYFSLYPLGVKPWLGIFIYFLFIYLFICLSNFVVEMVCIKWANSYFLLSLLLQVTTLVEQRISYFSPIFHVMLPRRAAVFDFSVAYEYSNGAFCMARPALRPRWQSLYHPLAPTVWAAALATVLLVPFPLYLVRVPSATILPRRASKSANITPCLISSSLSPPTSPRTKEPPVVYFQFSRHNDNGEDPPRRTSTGYGDRGLLFAVDTVISTIFAQSFVRRTLSGGAYRVLLGFWLVFALVLGLAYRCNLTAALTLPKFPPRAETLSQLVETGATVGMLSYGKQFREFFAESTSSDYQTIARRFAIVPSATDGLDRALTSKYFHTPTSASFVYVAARRYVKLLVAKKYTKADGSCDLYLGRENVYPGMSGWPFPHDAPYKHVFDKKIMQVTESGLYDQWSREIVAEAQRQGRLEAKLLEEEAKAKRGSEDDPDKEDQKTGVLTLDHMQGLFFLIVLGWILSIVVFTLEVATHRFFPPDSSDVEIGDKSHQLLHHKLSDPQDKHTVFVSLSQVLVLAK